ncbi:MAG: hypothetical protein ACOCZ5_01405 [bacterium]
MIRKKETIKELWAIVDEKGQIYMSRGGSSSKSRIMVYSSEGIANTALKNSWTQQVIDKEKAQIKKIYIV